MVRDVEDYVQTCLIFQQENANTIMQEGLLQPFPVMDNPWESVSMDFITQLPATQGYSEIIFVVDHFSKYAVFILMKRTCGAENIVHMFFKHIVKYWGIPSNII
jgi:hypothetical protein